MFQHHNHYAMFAIMLTTRIVYLQSLISYRSTIKSNTIWTLVLRTIKYTKYHDAILEGHATPCVH